MSKPKPSWKLLSCGIYSAWDKKSRSLPEIVEFTHDIPARLGIEFGYIVQIIKAKGKKVHFIIEHPNFPDESGNPTPAFTGEVYVRTNDWEFFLGDTLWEPLEDKLGSWRLILSMDGTTMADETFEIMAQEE